MLKVNPSEAALIIVDPQNAFCHPEGTLAQSGVNVSGLIASIPRIVELVRLCRAAGVPDIWTRHYNWAVDKGRQAKRIEHHTAKRKRIASQPGTWDSEFVDEVKPLVTAQSHVIEKYRWSAFYGTQLDVLLRILGTKLVIFCGGTTNACIDTSVRDAYMRDYDVVVVKDCIAGVRDDWHETALAVWSHYVGEVVTLSEFRDMLSQETAA